jgi:hypothetical protein
VHKAKGPGKTGCLGHRLQRIRERGDFIVARINDVFTVTCSVNGITHLFSIRNTAAKALINVVNYLDASIDSFATPNILCKES